MSNDAVAVPVAGVSMPPNVRFSVAMLAATKECACMYACVYVYVDVFVFVCVCVEREGEREREKGKSEREGKQNFFPSSDIRDHQSMLTHPSSTSYGWKLCV